MWRRLIEPFFFSNYFLGVLAISLSLETSFQLSLPLNSMLWYAILFASVIIYYTYAYSSERFAAIFSNPRTQWYAFHAQWVRQSQVVLSGLLLIVSTIFLGLYHVRIPLLSAESWAIVAAAVLSAGAYYGKIPFFNLRHATWTKPLTIGFCWAVAVSLMPVMALELERGPLETPRLLVGWFFLKNWMFCAVNAVLFDVKDYADDSNKQVKTFVVKYGTRFTISFIILPMIIMGIASFLLFAGYRGFSVFQILVNLLPFVLTFYIALSTAKKERSILYYLILIDGMLLVKALCGITATLLP